MATTSGNMKGFYRQRKKSGITKPKASKPSLKTKSLKPTFGSDVTQPPTLLSHGSPDLKGFPRSLSI